MRAISQNTRSIIVDSGHWLMLALSLALVVYISIDTFDGSNFLENRRYMTFQLWVCLFFIADFFVELIFADDRWHYFRHRWPFLLVSIPYLNIVTHFNLPLTPEEIYFVRFIPLTRAIYAMALAVGYVSVHRITSLLASYLTVLVSLLYCSSLVFFYEEHSVNPMVGSYWDALWWACMNSTTLGCDIYPVQWPGKVLSAVLSMMGMIMFPLFTVYFTSLVRRYSNSRQAQRPPGRN